LKKLILLLLILLIIISCKQEEIYESISDTQVNVSTSTTTTTVMTSTSLNPIVETKLPWQPPVDTLDLAAKKKCSYYKYNLITEYDEYFRKYSKQYMYLGFDYLYLKAQAVAESNLNPNAISPVGAIGILQVMPGTYKDIVKRNPSIKGSSKEAKWNIAAGVYYMSGLWNSWKPKYSWLDHHSFCTSSYNAGQGNIIKAQSKAKSMNLNTEVWSSIKLSLPSITGHFSKETIDYVDRIQKIRSCLVSDNIKGII